MIVSLTTYPKRMDYFKKSIQSILNQTIFDKVDHFYINIDDNLTQDEYNQYDEFKNLNDKIIIQKCDHKWRAANKLLPTYKIHHDDVIVCFDDDKNYPLDCLENLYNEWIENKDCIICYEINPAIIENGKLKYLNAVDVKLKQKEYGKYLSNGCLFCPNCLTDLVYDYDTYFNITNGANDEVWFWIVSTLNNVKVIGLDRTFSWEMDENVCYEKASNDLTNINCKPEIIQKYNDKFDELYHDQISKILSENYVEFNCNHSNILAICGQMNWIYTLYRNFNIMFVCDKTIGKSWLNYLISNLNKYKWNNVKIKIA